MTSWGWIISAIGLLLNIVAFAIGYGRLAQKTDVQGKEIEALRLWRHEKVNQQASAEARDYLFSEIMKKIDKLESKIERLESRISGGLH